MNKKNIADKMLEDILHRAELEGINVETIKQLIDNAKNKGSFGSITAYQNKLAQIIENSDNENK